MDEKHSKKERKEIIDKLEVGKDGYVTLYKVFTAKPNGDLMPQFKNYVFYEGKNTARGKYITNLAGAKDWNQYQPGFHSFVKKKDAASWMRRSNTNGFNTQDVVIYPVKIRKSWITNTGVHGDRITIVSEHIVI